MNLYFCIVKIIVLSMSSKHGISPYNTKASAALTVWEQSEGAKHVRKPAEISHTVKNCVLQIRVTNVEFNVTRSKAVDTIRSSATIEQLIQNNASGFNHCKL